MNKTADNKEYSAKTNKNFAGLIITISVIANIIILLLFFSPIGYEGAVQFDLTIFPRLNAIFNSFTFIFLVAALIAIIKKNVKIHKVFILLAFTTTLLFLVSYLTFHYISPETAKYGGEGFIRPIYFFILITHSFLAAIVVPLALFALVWGWTMQIAKHKRIVRWTMPIWLYVSLTGVIVYLMMAPYY
ncbi:DUF420 domain-containing protein [Paenibacillus sp. CAA11]|uniref:DUF420 domain-containing protein n=1 Tax=Paenibacillus sp. CAA11 TaxID=1532905 RepID=UPI000D355C65|nr:DUF420 domain-containing protein [Paenibacillus sp. CAA11]AWB44003.1 DUF420 domain-containing protein [Paenibacillus sp. CAA11]